MSFLRSNVYRLEDRAPRGTLEKKLEKARKAGFKVNFGEVRLFGQKIRDVIEVEDDIGRKHWYKEEAAPTNIEKLLTSWVDCRIYSGGFEAWRQSLSPHLKTMLR